MAFPTVSLECDDENDLVERWVTLLLHQLHSWLVPPNRVLMADAAIVGTTCSWNICIAGIHWKLVSGVVTF